jgi:uncharacterized protein YndB with AHSA1/START domain
MPYSYTLSTMIPASPVEIYQAWLDSIIHSEMTGGEANMSAEVGADVSAWDGYITGRNLDLVPGERIVQSWRTTEFDDAYEDSIVSIVLQETDDGTLLTLEHSNVPDAQRSYEEGGWQSNYFEPMIAYFAGLRGQVLVEPETMQEPGGGLASGSGLNAPGPAAKSAPRAGRRRKASAGPRRRASASARKAKPVAATKKKATARAARAGKKASAAPAKKAAKKSQAKASAKTSARGGRAKKKAAPANTSRRKSARGRRG